MDYKYIEQLLERYWQCQTTLQEEAILRAFFSQPDVPASLMQYRSLFVAQSEALEQNVLGNDFDNRLLLLMKADEHKETARFTQQTLFRRLRPLYRAAAVVAIFLTLGTALQKSATGNREFLQSEPYGTQSYGSASIDSHSATAGSDSVDTKAFKHKLQSKN